MAKVLQALLSPRKCRTKNKSLEIDIKSGKIFLIQSNDGKQVRHKIYMKVFRNTYEHHAQMYTDSDYKFMYGYVSMRTCKVTNTPGTNEITIHSDKMIEGSTRGLVFEVENHEDVAGWIDALRPNIDLPSVSELSPGMHSVGRSRSSCNLKEFTIF